MCYTYLYRQYILHFLHIKIVYCITYKEFTKQGLYIFYKQQICIKDCVIFCAKEE